MLKGKTITQKVYTYAIGHVDDIRWVMVLCIIAFLVTLLLATTVIYHTCMVFILGLFMLAGVIFYAIYLPSSRFREAIDVLSPSLFNVEWVGRDTLKFTTANLGEFYMYYKSEGEHESAYYKVWITSDKNGPVTAIPRVTLWKRPYKSILGKWLYFQSPPYVPAVKANEIKTLKWISIDWFGNHHRIMARLSDDWLHSETDDLLKTVEVLEEIYTKM